jgi:hypothetical protein
LIVVDFGEEIHEFSFVEDGFVGDEEDFVDDFLVDAVVDENEVDGGKDALEKGEEAADVAEEDLDLWVRSRNFRDVRAHANRELHEILVRSFEAHQVHRIVEHRKITLVDVLEYQTVVCDQKKLLEIYVQLFEVVYRHCRVKISHFRLYRRFEVFRVDVEVLVV